MFFPDCHFAVRRSTLLLTLGMVLSSLLLSGCISIPLSRRSADLRSEVLVEPEHFATRWSGDSVLLVELNGVLSAEPETGGFLSEPGTLVHLKDALKKAEEDPFVQALLVRIDSPGGSVTASDLIYTELKRFKERTKKKVVAVCMGTAASGGYYAAMAADYIVVHPTTVTGSIGVISMYPNLSGLAKLARVDMRVLKSGERKDMGSMWREMEPAEREILQGVINSMYERFLEVVAAGRPNLSADKIRELADGRIYTAQQAVELGWPTKSGISRTPSAKLGNWPVSRTLRWWPTSSRATIRGTIMPGIPNRRRRPRLPRIRACSTFSSASPLRLSPRTRRFIICGCRETKTGFCRHGS
jgi:protease-4